MFWGCIYRYSFVVLVVLFSASCAPKFDIAHKQDYPDPFTFSFTDTVTAGKNDLFVRANTWISKNYGSAKAVIDMQDKEAGTIIGKCLMDIPVKSSQMGIQMTVVDQASYILQIDVKDGKYRVRIEDIVHKGYTYNSNGRVYNGHSFGDLSKAYILRKDPNTGTPLINEQNRYWAIKNYCMSYVKTTFASLQKSMHTPKDDF